MRWNPWFLVVVVFLLFDVAAVAVVWSRWHRAAVADSAAPVAASSVTTVAVAPDALVLPEPPRGRDACINGSVSLYDASTQRWGEDCDTVRGQERRDSLQGSRDAS